MQHYGLLLPFYIYTDGIANRIYTDGIANSIYIAGIAMCNSSSVVASLSYYVLKNGPKPTYTPSIYRHCTTLWPVYTPRIIFSS